MLKSCASIIMPEHALFSVQIPTIYTYGAKMVDDNFYETITQNFTIQLANYVRISSMHADPIYQKNLLLKNFNTGSYIQYSSESSK